MTLIVVAIFGLVIGSFLNVVICRLPHDKSLIRPGSACPHCETPIKAWQNIPVLSFLFLRAKCAACSKAISVRYPLVEILTAFLFLIPVLRHGWNIEYIYRDYVFFCILIASTFIDLDHRIIPDELSIGGTVMGLLGAHFSELGIWQSLLGAGFGFGCFYALAWIYEKRTGKVGLGGGDIKFLAMVGSFLGPFSILYTVLISSVAGSVIGIGLGLFRKEQSLLKVSIPYGPFLAIGAFLYYFLGDFLWLQYTNPT